MIPSSLNLVQTIYNPSPDLYPSWCQPAPNLLNLLSIWTGSQHSPNSEKKDFLRVGSFSFSICLFTISVWQGGGAKKLFSIFSLLRSGEIFKIFCCQLFVGQGADGEWGGGAGWVRKFLKVYSSILYSPMITVMALRVIEKEEEEKCDEQTDKWTEWQFHFLSCASHLKTIS